MLLTYCLLWLGCAYIQARFQVDEDFLNVLLAEDIDAKKVESLAQAALL